MKYARTTKKVFKDNYKEHHVQILQSYLLLYKFFANKRKGKNDTSTQKIKLCCDLTFRGLCISV